MPPIRPSSQRTSRMTMIVQSIEFSSLLLSVSSAISPLGDLLPTSQGACQCSLAARATLLDHLVDEQDRGGKQEEIHPLTEAQDDSGQPEHQGDRRRDPDHG